MEKKEVAFIPLIGMAKMQIPSSKPSWKTTEKTGSWNRSGNLRKINSSKLQEQSQSDRVRVVRLVHDVTENV